MTNQDVKQMGRQLQVGQREIESLRASIAFQRKHLAHLLSKWQAATHPSDRRSLRADCRSCIFWLRTYQSNLRTWGAWT